MSNIEESFRIIKEMKHGDYLSKWIDIRNRFKNNLDSGAYRQDKEYTPHDYSRHCVNIYTILDSILLKNVVFDDDNFNSEHLFILNVAVILHDIFMAYNPEVRDSHSQHARNFVIEQQREFKLPLDADQAKCVGDVILGHSDLKSEKITSTIDLLVEKDMSLTGKSGKKIDVRLLSALLRLADELDENSKRIDGTPLENYGIKIGNDSWKHWRKCELLLFPTIHNTDNRTIFLNINNELLRKTEVYPTDYKILLNVKEKISSELKMLNDKVFSKKDAMDAMRSWTFSKIEFCCDLDIKEKIDNVKNDVDKTSPNILISEIVDPISTTGQEIKELLKYSPVASDVEFEKIITSYVIKNKIIRSGHFLIDTDGKRCARDWIDIDYMLDDSLLRDEILKRFLGIIGTTSYNIIGIGHNGLLMASIIGYHTNNPFSYIIPNRHKSFNVKTDKLLAIDDKLKILLVSDVIVTGKTLQDAIDELIKKYNISDDNIDKILTIFVRKPVYDIPNMSIPFLDKIHFLNNQLSIELCPKPSCYSCIFKEYNIDIYENSPTII